MTRRAVLALLAVAGLVLWYLVPNAAAAHLSRSSLRSRTLPGAVPAVVATHHATRIGVYSKSATVGLAVGLGLRSRQRLNQTLAAINNPNGPRYHRYLTQAQANRLFNPTLKQQAAVIAWLRANRLTVTRTYPNHLIVDARGSAARVERMLHVSLQRYRARVGRHNVRFFAPSAAPRVPAQVAGIVTSIVGLDSLPRFHILSNGSADNSPPYYPQDLANAYDVNSLWNAGYTGAGQHIGITLWTVPPSDSTLQHFGSITGANVATVADGRLHVIKVDGGTTTADQGEAGMDIEYSGGLAPGANIDYYEAPTSGGNPTNQGLIDALNQAGTDSNNNREISNSWGGCEASSTSDSFTSQAESVFASNSATGHNYFFSSGDNGSWCDTTGYGIGTDPYPDFPTSSPYVTSVGGTSFSGSVNGGYPGETAWAYCSTCNSGAPEGSGGGYSNIFSRPSWQTGSGLAANGKRGYPDIAADADPNTGAEVCYGSSSSCGQFGGTSLASPSWAGMVALVNQYLAAQSKPALGFLDPTLYSLAGSSQSYPPFHDVTSGTNGSYNAGSGWDAVTGWGSVDLWNLARDVAGSSASSPTPTPTTPTPTTPTPTPTTPTPTPTTPTPTPTTPTPTPTSTNPGGSQLVVNGGFENGQSPWSESSSGGYQIIDPTRPHTGSYSAWLCGYNRCNDQIWQKVTLPSSFSKVTLTYWLYSDTSEATGSPCYDYFYSKVRTSSGGTIKTTQTQCNTSVTNGWVQYSFDVTSALSSYKGQSVQVYFQGKTDSSLPSDFFVDDVTLTAS
ncbi:MAG TPA: protease pro-enzyme activation domain-containing protein [Chloroflexota bacterium]|nr:protease pro-enzyme activation domain-containing protein [Chloroflexota bacterium]